MRRLFIIGMIGYPAIELLFRGRTHYSMAFAGATSTVLIDQIRKLPFTFLSKSVLCGTAITCVEYLCGIVWNRQYKVWDYRNVPLNIDGQICIPYSLLWCVLSAGFMATLNLLDHHKKPDS